MDFGFAETFSQQWMNKSKYFPMKVGGKPSFLILNPVLGPEEVSCEKCKKTMRFLLQLYAPIDSNDHAFHRQLLVFVCGRSEQCSDQFRIFRCQLPIENRFYSSNPPDYDSDSKEYDPDPVNFGISLCPVCGIKAAKKCSQCMVAKYCSREHQVLHWKKGGHKQVCLEPKNQTLEKQIDHAVSYGNIVFPEFEIVIEDGSNNYDDFDDDDGDGGPQDHDDKATTEIQLKKYQDFLAKNKPTFQDENLEPYVVEKNDEDQKMFDKFKKESKRGEIIRYNSDWHQTNHDDSSLERILWISDKSRLKAEDIPKCENCGTNRIFEFQIMPSLLNKIMVDQNQIDPLDWGTLVVFSCPKSCMKNLNNKSNDPLDYYLPEFIFNQSIC